MKRIGLACVLATLASLSLAQTLPREIKDFYYTQSDVRAVMRALAERYKINYAISPEVKGQISCSVSSEPFETALLKILAPIHATFSIQNNVVHVMTEDELLGRNFVEATRMNRAFQGIGAPFAIGEIFTQFKRRLRLDRNVKGNVSFRLANATFADSVTAFLDEINGSIWLVDGVYNIRTRPAWDVARKDKVFSLELTDTDVREALRELFREGGTSYTIAPDVQGSITVALKNVTFETALQNILKQVNATYRIEGGVYIIIDRG